jgi:hypothetical protein
MGTRPPVTGWNCFVKITLAPTCFLFPVFGLTVCGGAPDPTIGLKPKSLGGEGSERPVCVRLQPRCPSKPKGAVVPASACRVRFGPGNGCTASCRADGTPVVLVPARLALEDGRRSLNPV